MNAEQSTSVMGEGRNPTVIHLVKLGQEAKLNKKLIGDIIDQTVSALSGWKKLAQYHNISKASIELIGKAINNDKLI